jgi:hypothetical protein
LGFQLEAYHTASTEAINDTSVQEIRQSACYELAAARLVQLAGTPRDPEAEGMIADGEKKASASPRNDAPPE